MKLYVLVATAVLVCGPMAGGAPQRVVVDPSQSIDDPDSPKESFATLDPTGTTTLQRQRERYQTLEKKAESLAREYHAASRSSAVTRNQLNQLKVELVRTVRQAFEARQRLQQEEVEQYRQRLTLIEARIRRREKLMDKIVDNRVGRLLNSASNDPTAVESGSDLTTPRSLNSSGQAMQALVGSAREPAEMQAVGPKSVQVLFSTPHTMNVSVIRGDDRTQPLVCPGRLNLEHGTAHLLRLTKIPERPGVELFPSLEVAPVTPRSASFLRHNSIAVQLTTEDFDQVESGNFVTKVLFLPDPDFQETALAGIESLVSTRVDPGVDPILEADRQGTIVAILRLGNRRPIAEALAEAPPAVQVVAVEGLSKVVLFSPQSQPEFRLQQRFTVHAAGEPGEALAATKGLIEVTKVLSRQLAEARILESDAASPMTGGDIAHVFAAADDPVPLDEPSAEQRKPQKQSLLDTLDDLRKSQTKVAASAAEEGRTISTSGQLAKIKLARARTLVKLAETENDAERRALAKQARQEFFLAREQITQWTEAMKRALDDGLERESTDAGKYKRLQADYLQSLLMKAQCIEETADTAKGAELAVDLLIEAAKEYAEVHRRYRSRVAGLYAQLYEARCYHKLGDHKRAIGICNQLELQPGETAQFVDLRRQASELAAKCRASQGK